MSRVRVLSACCAVGLCLTLLSPAAASGQTEAYTIKTNLTSFRPSSVRSTWKSRGLCRANGR